ncbi:MAG: sensor histidine kinase [Bacteroidales bacterium]|nr:sensor histidine kinase [Bacteroidales bacterium]
MDKKVLYVIWPIAIIFAALLILYYIRVQTRETTFAPTAKEAVFDFAKLDFKTHPFVSLHGEVGFYWNQLLTPADFGKDSLPEPPTYQKIPSSWTEVEINNRKLTRRGYGTYRFTILTPDDEWYGIKIKEFETAFKIWINGQPMGGAGKVGKSKQDMTPSWQRKEFYAQATGNKLDVVLQISNFYHRQGGATETISFGPANEIARYKEIHIGLDLFLLGIMLILGLYHMILYSYRQRDKSLLYFALICMFMFFRLGTTGEKTLLEILPFLTWQVAIRIEYISFMALTPSISWFLQVLFPKEIKPKIAWIATWISLGFIAVVLFTPSTVFSFTPSIFQLLIVAIASYLLVILFLCILRKREFALIIFGGFFILFITVINDLLSYRKIIETAYFLPLGILTLIVSQAFVLARRSSSAFTRIEHLSSRLERINKELETRVQQRTKQISEQKDEIELQRKNLETKSEQLIQINKELQELTRFKTEITQMMVHDLKNPLNNIIGFSQIDETYSEYRDLIHATGWGMLNLIRNILDVEKYETSQLELSLETIQLKDIVEVAYQTNQYLIFRLNIRFDNQVSGDTLVRVDREITERVFSNIIANATKYGNDNGLIRVTAEELSEKGRNWIKVSIYNSGERIPEDKLSSIFNKFNQAYAQKGQFAYSTGIGLAFCRMAIQAHQGKIGVVSHADKGVTFWFTLPKG